MPRKPNYQFEKRQKELERKSRKEAKLKRRQERTAEADTSEPGDTGSVSDDADRSEGDAGAPASEE
jgi:hypothetical protein